VRLNGKWDLLLPKHRAERPEWTTGWERERLDSMKRHLAEGDVIYDIGAEEGDMSALYASWGCQVVLVEPNPAVWPCTRTSFEMNDLKPRAWYVGMVSDFDSGGADADYGTESWPPCAFDRMIPDHGQHQIGQNDDPTTTLDALVDRIGAPPDALTIDVEGGELHVLRGADQTLRYARPKVWCSVHFEMLADIHGKPVGEELFALMVSYGYRYELLAFDHELHVLWTA
jgi:FkbM family methyltransferase